MKLSEIKGLLDSRAIQLTRSLGQNFLHDANQLRRIVRAAELAKTDHVLEIGPGLGPLTELLLERAGKVLAIEKDERLVRVLEERFSVKQTSEFPVSPAPPELKTGSSAVLCLIHDDALDYLRREPRVWSGWKLVANLPYSAASPLLVELAQSRPGPERLVATLQTEVARRLMAQAGQADYGVLTLLVQLAYQPQGWFKIPASCFFPKPAVESACVCLLRRREPLLPPQLQPAFGRIVKHGFSQRRKMLLKLLKADWPAARVETAFRQVGLSLQTRAEDLSLEQFVRLTQALSEAPGHE
jgi:16S rRNA (adenine1518-N6/adenine1519-N6)-dimethyltransferase